MRVQWKMVAITLSRLFLHRGYLSIQPPPESLMRGQGEDTNNPDNGRRRWNGPTNQPGKTHPNQHELAILQAQSVYNDKKMSPDV